MLTIPCEKAVVCRRAHNIKALHQIGLGQFGDTESLMVVASVLNKKCSEIRMIP